MMIPQESISTSKLFKNLPSHIILAVRVLISSLQLLTFPTRREVASRKTNTEALAQKPTGLILCNAAHVWYLHR